MTTQHVVHISGNLSELLAEVLAERVPGAPDHDERTNLKRWNVALLDNVAYDEGA